MLSIGQKVLVKFPFARLHTPIIGNVMGFNKDKKCCYVQPIGKKYKTLYSIAFLHPIEWEDYSI